MDEYHVFSSDDMINWTDHGEILRASQVPWGKPLKDNAKFMWAPDCVFKNGTYYFYFPHPSEDPWGKNWKIGVATSTKPASDFKVIGYIPNIEPLIDPCVFVDDDGQAYFYHGGGGTCKAGKLKDNMMEIDGEMKVMEGLEDFHEATWIHKRNGIYYLSYSDNHENGKEGVKGNNRMRYATSNKPLGPWKYQGIYMDPTDSYTNHGSIVEYKGQWYAFYHNSKLSAGNGEPNDWLRSICVDKLYYNEDGTIKKVVQTNPVTPSLRGEKSSWHGFDRYDYLIDEQTLQLSPRKNEEGNGVAGPKPGTRHCVVVVPKQAAPGNPWTWRGCYWDHAPQAEIELLKRGFHVAYITTDPDETWDIWYKFLLKEYGLSPKPAFIGMSRGGANAFTWGTNHPENVTAICADNPGLSQTSLMKMDLLAANNVPILNICGSVDPILYNTYGIQGVYHGNGGRMSVIIKDGPAHHPHSLNNPAIIADFIEQSFNEEEVPKPAFLPDTYKKSAFYSTKPQYEYTESERLWLTKWGPYFTGSYNKYSFSLKDVEGSVTVILPPYRFFTSFVCLLRFGSRLPQA
ncbi:hypothetical protein AGMMS50276_32830 [Synergistales bacterium]|nr:hypothetical protein AGMMS50276_32830 [Synergistales bacterium]